MPRFAPNLHHQFLELDPAARFDAAARIGFDAVEWHFPYEFTKHELKTHLDNAGLHFVYAVTPSNWAEQNFGLAAQPGRETLFRQSADQALEYAAHIGFKCVQVAPGELTDLDARPAFIETLYRNLDYICTQARGLPLTLCLEGVCDARFPGRRFVLRTIDDAIAVTNALAHDNLKVVFDTYHLRMQERGSLIDLLESHYDRIGHVQIGNAPVRNEPGVGEIDLHCIVERFDAKGYPGWIGLEYDPSGSTWESLEWSSRYGYTPRRRAE